VISRNLLYADWLHATRCVYFFIHEQLAMQHYKNPPLPSLMLISSKHWHTAHTQVCLHVLPVQGLLVTDE